jgi:TRAP transporter TAXI family solute receptor
MRKQIVVSLFLALLSPLVVCHTSFAEEFKWPKTLNIQSKASMGPYYQTIAAWGPLLEQDTGTKVRVSPATTPIATAKNLIANKMDIAGDDGDSIVLAQQAADAFAQKNLGPFNVRAIWGFEPVFRGVIVRGDSEINSLQDIKAGTSFSVPPGPHAVMDAYATAAWLGLERDEIKIVTVGSGPGAARAVAEGKADCSHVMSTDPLVYELEAGPYGIKWLSFDMSIDPEAAERWRDVKPLTFFGVPPKEMKIIKSAEGLPLWGNSNFFTAKAELDDELVYNLVKWLNENLDRFKSKHDSAYSYSVNEFRKTLDTSFIPLHNGTVKYLKELNMWSAEDAKRQAYNLSVFDSYVKAYQEAIADAEAKNIKINPQNAEWMDLWASHKKDLPVIRLMTKIP